MAVTLSGLCPYTCVCFIVTHFMCNQTTDSDAQLAYLCVALVDCVYKQSFNFLVKANLGQVYRENTCGHMSRARLPVTCMMSFTYDSKFSFILTEFIYFFVFMMRP